MRPALTRWLSAAALLLVGAGAAVAQPAKPPAVPDATKPATPPAAGTTPPAPKPAAPAPKPKFTVAAEEKSFKTADGVKLVGTFYKTSNPSASVVLMLHPFGTDPEALVWNETALMLGEKGFNVFRFAHRGHGKSTDYVPNEFFAQRFNQNYVSGAGSATPKPVLEKRDFKSGYYPMLVQDIAAARNAIDLLNDNGELNSSTVYLLGVGDAVNLGMLFLGTEWLRERQRPNTLVPPQFVAPRRGLLVGADAAGNDYGGAVWISPSTSQIVTTAQLKNVVLSPYAINLRNETPMVFIHEGKDAKAQTAAKAFVNEVLAANAKSNPISPGVKLQKAEQVFIKKVDKPGLKELQLIGSGAATEEIIVQFLSEIDAQRKSRTRKTRDWDKPLIIDIAGFGVGR